MLKKIFSVILSIALLFILENYSNAASATIQCSSEAKVNSPVTISVSGSAVQWNLNLKVNGKTIASSSEVENVEGNKAISFSGTYTPTSEENITVTLEGSATEASDGSTKTSFGSKTINVKKVENNNNSSSNGSQNNNSSSNGNSNSNSDADTQQPQEKSSNANLNNLGINPNDFKGFKPGTTKYNVTVENNVESVEVYAKAQDSKAKVSGTGIKKLNEGNNALNVVVTAEDGTKKTYTINVARKTAEESKEAEEENNKEEEKQENKLGLSELNIEGVELSPSFSLNTYEYVAKYIGEETKLNITTKASDDNAKVEIVGNEELKEGENLINILVTDSKGENTVTYQITLNKSLVDKEAIAKSQAQEQKQKNEKAIFIGVSAIIILIIIIILLIIKVRKNKNLDQYSINYSDYDDENYDNYQVENEEEQYNNQILERESSKKKSKGKRFK